MRSLKNSKVRVTKVDLKEWDGPKPLTLDELKELDSRDWVWLISIKQLTLTGLGYFTHLSFTKKMFSAKTVTMNNKWSNFRFDDYGRTWLAYRNKEEANGKISNSQP